MVGYAITVSRCDTIYAAVSEDQVVGMEELENIRSMIQVDYRVLMPNDVEWTLQAEYKYLTALKLPLPVTINIKGDDHRTYLKWIKVKKKLKRLVSG